MSHVHVFGAELVGKPPFEKRTPAPKTRRDLKKSVRAIALFAFGFGSTSLLIHIAVGFFLASRMSCLLPFLNI
jgi:hypothetical protein